jgi:hypothetical protein
MVEVEVLAGQPQQFPNPVYRDRMKNLVKGRGKDNRKNRGNSLGPARGWQYWVIGAEGVPGSERATQLKLSLPPDDRLEEVFPFLVKFQNALVQRSAHDHVRDENI